MRVAVILFNDVKPFEQSVNIPPTERPLWNLVKIGQVVLQKKTFKNFLGFLPVYSTGQGQVTRRGKILFLIKTFYYFNHTL